MKFVLIFSQTTGTVYICKPFVKDFFNHWMFRVPPSRDPIVKVDFYFNPKVSPGYELIYYFEAQYIMFIVIFSVSSYYLLYTFNKF